jgi:ribulose-phosphate 3-epimerase
MNEIIPAVLGKTLEVFQAELDYIPPEIPLIQIDVLEEDVWVEPKRAFEAHLMVADPDATVDKWLERGAERIISHMLTDKILSLRGQVKLGLGVEMVVDLESIWESVPKVDFVQLMSIAEIGEQGHPLDERIFDRIKLCKEKFPSVPVSIDGGVNVTNYKKLLEAGADRLVVGSGFKDLWHLLTNA